MCSIGRERRFKNSLRRFPDGLGKSARPQSIHVAAPDQNPAFDFGVANTVLQSTATVL
jgi:hypothetical protein